ncbi:MAG: tyrosine-type recombinase/integrase [Desulfovibrionaceae bacterium]
MLAHSKRVFSEKRFIFQRFFKVVGADMPAERLTKQIALDYLQAQARKRSGHAANKERKNLVAAWNWGAEYMDLPTLNPFKVRKFPEEKHPRYMPPLEDFWAVYQQADRADQVFLLTFLYTAARRGEVFSLTWEDVDFARNRVRLFTRKRAGGNREGDWVEMVQELRESLLWWWENRPHKDSPYVFTVHGGHTFENQHEGEQFRSRQHFLRKLCEKAGVKPFGFHAIRHLTASILDMAGKELTLIQGVLRHQNPYTTARYLHSLRGVRAELEDSLPKPPAR